MFSHILAEQLQSVNELKKWLDSVAKVDMPAFRRTHFQQFTPSDVFIGYHDDAPASIVLRLGKEGKADTKTVIEQVIFQSSLKKK